MAKNTEDKNEGPFEFVDNVIPFPKRPRSYKTDCMLLLGIIAVMLIVAALISFYS